MFQESHLWKSVDIVVFCQHCVQDDRGRGHEEGDNGDQEPADRYEFLGKGLQGLKAMVGGLGHLAADDLKQQFIAHLV